MSTFLRGPVNPVKDWDPMTTGDLDRQGLFIPGCPCMRIPKSTIDTYDPAFHPLLYFTGFKSFICSSA